MIRHTLTLKHKQKLIMTPELRQAITLLGMPLVELRDYILAQYEANPLLEISSEDTEGSCAEDCAQLENTATIEQKNDYSDGEDNDLCWDEWKRNLADSTNRLERAQYDAGHNFLYEQHLVAAPQTDIYSHLHFQLNTTPCSAQELLAGRYIIESLNTDGYLLLEPEQIAENLRLPSETVASALALVRSFDPPGIAAVSLCHCLIMQLDHADEDYEWYVRIIEEHLPDVAANRLTRVAKNLGLSTATVQHLVDGIKRLHPKPGQHLHRFGQVHYVVPDVYIEKGAGDYVISVNEGGYRLHLNQPYLGLLSGHQAGSGEDVGVDARKYMLKKLSQATSLINAIERRRTTIYRIAEAMLILQENFFTHGKDYVHPLNMADVADLLEINVSTVSRAVSNKYVQTPHGLFAWKYFFAQAVAADSNKSITPAEIKAKIKRIIDQEDSAKPYPDRVINEKLREQGLQVSVRLISKYREQMHIGNSNRRKRY